MNHHNAPFSLVCDVTPCVSSTDVFPSTLVTHILIDVCEKPPHEGQNLIATFENFPSVCSMRRLGFSQFYG